MKNVERLIVECSLARAAAIFDVYVPKSGRHDCTRDDCFDDSFPALVKSLIEHRHATVDGEHSVGRGVSEHVRRLRHRHPALGRIAREVLVKRARRRPSVRSPKYGWR